MLRVICQFYDCLFAAVPALLLPAEAAVSSCGCIPSAGETLWVMLLILNLAAFSESKRPDKPLALPDAVGKAVFFRNVF